MSILLFHVETISPIDMLNWMISETFCKGGMSQ
jgi:hypothetical protein